MQGKRGIVSLLSSRLPALLLCLTFMLRLVCQPPGLSAARRNDLLSAVPALDGLLLPPNSTADGGGCLVLRDRIPTGVPLAEAGRQPSVGACCAACRQQQGCSVFAFCPLAAGCAVDSAYGSATSLPFRGCLLLSQGLSAPETGRPMVAMRAPGFLGGAPIVTAASPVEGFELLAGHGFHNRFDYECAGSLSPGRCMLRGNPQALARRCNLDPRCRAMVYLPAGWEYLGTSTVVFKGGAGVSLAAGDATLNQNAISYLKLQPVEPIGGSGMSGGTVAGLLVSACTTTAAVVAGAAALCWRWQRRLDKAAAAATAPAAAVVGGSPEASYADRQHTPKQGLHNLVFEEEQRMRTGAWVAQQHSSSTGTATAMTGSLTSSVAQPPSPMHLLHDSGAGRVPRRLTMEQALQRRASFAGAITSDAARAGLPTLRSPSAGSSDASAAGSESSGGAAGGSRQPGSAGSGARSGEQGVSGGCSGDFESGTRPGSAGSGARSGEQGVSGGCSGDSESGTRSGALGVSNGSSSGGSERKLEGCLSWEESVGALLSHSNDSGSLDDASGSSSLAAANATTQMLSRMPEAPWQDWVVSVDDIEFFKTQDGSFQELGSGGFGTVYRVMLDGVQVYAAKVIELGQSAGVQSAFLREVSLLRRLRHRSIVNFRGVCISEGKGILLMEMMEGGDLQSKLALANKMNEERLFSWHNRGKRVALDVARGIHYLHSLSLTHFDIKANNVLLTRDLTAKISDVGFTRLMSNTHHSFNEGRTGTFSYMAPELLMGRPCTESVDIFSFGILLWEICTGERPARGQNRELRAPQDCPQEVVELYEACTSEDPAARPSARELVQRLVKLNAPPRPPSVPSS